MRIGQGNLVCVFCNIFLLNRLNTYLSCGLLDYSSSVSILWSNPVGLWEVQTLFSRSKQRSDDIYYGRYRIHNVYIYVIILDYIYTVYIYIYSILYTMISTMIRNISKVICHDGNKLPHEHKNPLSVKENWPLAPPFGLTWSTSRKSFLSFSRRWLSCRPPPYGQSTIGRIWQCIRFIT